MAGRRSLCPCGEDMMTDNIAGGGLVCLLDPRDGSMLELLRGDLSTETLPSIPIRVSCLRVGRSLSGQRCWS